MRLCTVGEGIGVTGGGGGGVGGLGTIPYTVTCPYSYPIT